MLTKQGRSIFDNPGRWSGTVANQHGNYIKGGFRNRSVGGLNNTFDGYANGHLSPSSFVLPTKPGSISSYTGDGMAITAGTPLYLIMGLPISGTATIIVTANPAQIDAIVPLVATSTITLAATNAELAAAVNASASGTITFSGNAELGGIFDLIASGNIVMSEDATMSALAWITASAGGPTPLSPEGLAAAVWSAPAVDNNVAGSMGEKLNDAGAAGNPWSALLVDNNSAGTFGNFVQKLLTVAKFLGFKFF